MTGLLLILISLAPAAEDGFLRFERQAITDRPYEAASAFDVDRDGVVDVVSGEYWWRGPDFATSYKIAEIAEVSEYYDDFSCYPMDVNGDDWIDIVSGGYFGGKLLWRENPKGTGEWTTHEVAQVGAIERNCFYDLDGDGCVEVFPTTSPLHIFRLNRDAEGRGIGSFTQFTVAEPGGGGHGIGFGDIDGDGNPDIVFANGWFEAPDDPFGPGWVWHPEFDLKWCASVPILVHDVNGDGKGDLIVGQAHDYGLDWWEQGVADDGSRTWTKHVIDADRSQYHDLQLADIDNDGQPELLSGKRYRAHNGHDPGANDPLGIYWFELTGTDVGARHTIDYGPAGSASGAGIYFWVEDLDGNGWLDVVAPGKQGLAVFRNFGLE